MLTLSLIFSTTLVAQVTIGSTNQPVSGALLDLHGAGASKGLGLPRVVLTNLEQLYMGDNKIENDDFDGTQHSKHIGLVVYNVGDNPSCPLVLPGVYVWNGNRWESLQSGGLGTSSGSSGNPDGTFSDDEGNTYGYKKIGTHTWMTENLRTLYKQGKPGNGINTEGGRRPRINPALWTSIVPQELIDIDVTNGNTQMQNRYTTVVVTNAANTPSIPAGAVTYKENDKDVTLTYEAYAQKYGLLYNHILALDACPQGWHLPSQAEWFDLFDALGGINEAGRQMKANNTKYTSTGWQRENPTEMVLPQYVPYPAAATTEASYNWGGCDTRNSGFGALPAGYAFNAGSKGYHFAEKAYFWSSTLSGTSYFSYSINRGIDNKVTEMARAGYFYSVRCVKD